MADQGGEKTHDPTFEKLRKARQEGDTWQSRDLATVTLCATFALLLMTSLTDTARVLFTDMHAILRTAPSTSSLADGIDASIALVGEAARRLALPLVFLACASFAASYLQVRPLFILKNLMPKLPRLNPLEGVKKKIFSKSPWADFAMNLAKLAVLASLAVWFIRGWAHGIVLAQRSPPHQIAAALTRIGVEALKAVVCVGLVFAVIDLGTQFRRWWNRLKMSRAEVEREAKQDQGDPHIKGHRKQLHHELTVHQMMQQLPEADVIIANPTHYAAALRFDPKRENAPRLLAKGQGHLARQIVRAAEARGIPVYRNLGLARSLQQLRGNRTIPKELYVAVQEVLRWVERRANERGKKVRWRR